MVSQCRWITRGVAAGWLLSLIVLAAPAARAQDLDGDGWSVEDGDCCDVPSGTCTRPELVNPGAYDVPGNGLDDDCDGIIDNPPPTNCSTGAIFSGVVALDLARALDLCQTTTENPPLDQRKWGLISAQLSKSSGPWPINPVQSAVMAIFGTQVIPVSNATMAVLSSGTARDINDPGYIAPNPGFQDPNGPVQAPMSFTGPNGGLYHRDGCPQPFEQVFDSAMLRLRLRVPTNASGLRFSHRFFSAEYPNTCNEYNDHLLCLLTSGASGLPADGNILKDGLGNPVTVQTAYFENCWGCPEGTGDLIGTGYGGYGPNGGGTEWHTSSAPVVPGETITLDFHIWDSTDKQMDALALLDGFQWTFIPQDPPVAVEDPGVKAPRMVLRARPNPFSGTTWVEFDLPEAAAIVLEIMDVSGRRVRRLAAGEFAAGGNGVPWDGRDDAGRAVGAGVYATRLQVDGKVASRLIVVER